MLWKNQFYIIPEHEYNPEHEYKITETDIQMHGNPEIQFAGFLF